MSIYTRGGDQGDTSLLSGRRVPKDDARVEAMGAVDELNASLGVAAAALAPGPTKELVITVQNDLFILGADLALPAHERPAKSFIPIAPARVKWLEETIDDTAERLGPQREFVLPGGHPAAAALHVARTVARRAERRVVHLAKSGEVNPEITRYLNRLSTFLHVLALEVNRTNGVPETHPKYS